MNSKPIIYLVGSLRNPEIPHIAIKLRDAGFEVYDAWWSASEDADDWWQKHETLKGSSYKQALNDHHAVDTCATDKKHLDRADIVVLVMPAGRSGHIELGYGIGAGKTTFVLFDAEPQRFDLMYKLCTDVCFSVEELIDSIKRGLALDTINVITHRYINKHTISLPSLER